MLHFVKHDVESVGSPRSSRWSKPRMSVNGVDSRRHSASKEAVMSAVETATEIRPFHSDTPALS